MRSNLRALLQVLLTVSAASAPLSASADYITVYGGTTVDLATNSGGATSNPMYVGGSTIVGNGVAVGTAGFWVNGADHGSRAVRWDVSGGTATLLGHLGTDSTGLTYIGANAVNSTGTAVGSGYKFAGTTYIGERAVRWNASGTAATELGNLGTTGSVSFPVTHSSAFAINGAGTAVGFVDKYISGTFGGERAVRWDASGTAATELGNLGIAFNGETRSRAVAINSAGAAVGHSAKYNAAGGFLGIRAVRWAASSTAITELGNPTDGFDYPNSSASAINDTGTAVGSALKYTGGVELGSRAIRWDASGTTASELDHLGVSGLGVTHCAAIAINSAGTTVGYAEKWDPSGANKGKRPIRWDASGATAIELSLGNFGTSLVGYTDSEVFAINNGGYSVGYVNTYIEGSYVRDRAVLWGLNAAAIDLNTLINPNSGWTLTRAYGISNTNWIAGIGQFDFDGAGPISAYPRGFLMDVSSLLAVPEPSSSTPLVFALIVLVSGRRLYII